MLKKVFIIFSILFIMMAILLLFNVNHLNLIWATIFALPVIFIADLCFLSLPVTVPAVLGLSIYSIVKKDYEKYNYAFEILLIIISCGIFNFAIDSLLSNYFYVQVTPCYRVYWLVFLLCTFILGIIHLRKFKDNRVYLWTFVPFLVFYMLYEVIKAAE